MKQLLVLSGKGGTGKTTITSALIYINQISDFADCDVDAPNLHIISKQKAEPLENDYYGFDKAVIDYDKCIKCGLCEANCRFGAIHDIKINPFECEGCSLCETVCPQQAIKMIKHSSGELILYKSKNSTFSTAKLNMGSGASGKLVSAVKKQLKDNIENIEEKQLSIIDGSPGIGCPVIASISGVDNILVVTEPSISGIHDMKRIINTAEKFQIPCMVCINKYDINLEKTNEIEEYCYKNELPLVGKISFDKNVIYALNSLQNIMEYKNTKIYEELNDLNFHIKKIINL